MAKMTRITGLKSVLKKYKKSTGLFATRVGEGLKDAGLHLQRKSQKVVPVDKGNLKNSAFTRAHDEGVNTLVVVGYTASYAIFVHENLEARHSPGQTAKFLERPAIDEAERMSEIIASHVEG
jgi:esterase/lipase superfamily enzyme